MTRYLILALIGCRPAEHPVEQPAFVGSEACRPCHAEVYDRWKQTRMANVVRDPKLHPEAILPDLSVPDPLLTFGVNDIAFVYGSRWKQRYFQRSGDDFVPLPAQWDVTHRKWRPYHVGENTDWWVPFYPPDNAHRPTGPLCDGCHSVSYDVRTKTVSEWNVGCEKCHGPGGAHARAPSTQNIVTNGGNDVCIQCHSQGRPPNGMLYDWPVGYVVGQPLSKFWALEEHAAGATTFTHFSDGTAHKNRMQGNDFVQSVMFDKGVTCSSCHDAHGTANPALLVFPIDAVCTQCHDDNSANGPRAGHAHHRPESASCVACHMPAIEQTIGDVMVRTHTFRFISPAQSATPNACTLCHADKTLDWAAAAMRTW